MRRIPILTHALLGLFIVFTPSHAEGQSVPSPYRFFETRQEAGLFAGVTGQGTGRFGFGPGPGPLYGARYSIHLGGPFGLEGVFGYSPTTRDVIDPTREVGNMVVGEADSELLSFDARLRFNLTGDRTWKGLSPFVFLGGGILWDTSGESESDGLVLPDDRFSLGTRFVAPLGGGVRWFMTRNLLLRADVSLTMFQIKSPRGFLDTSRGLTGASEKEWVSGPSFSLGMGFHF